MNKTEYVCQKCGKLVLPENYYGSGKFCCRQCANSRTYTEEALKRKHDQAVGRICYSDGEKVIFLKPDATPPEGFIPGNFGLVKNYNSLQEFNIVRNLNIKKVSEHKHIKLIILKSRIHVFKHILLITTMRYQKVIRIY